MQTMLSVNDKYVKQAAPATSRCSQCAWGALVIAPEVTAAALHLRPVAARLGPLRCALPGWLPPLRIALPVLPRGLRLREIDVGVGEVVLHLAADEWREPLPGTPRRGTTQPSTMTRLNRGRRPQPTRRIRVHTDLFNAGRRSGLQP